MAIEERRLVKEVEIPEGITVNVNIPEVTVKGPQGEIKKKLFDPMLKLEIVENKIKILPKKFAKKQKMLIHTYRAHLRNMISGVQKQFVYKMRICSGHFPMTVNVEGNKVVVKNFFGEKIPRVAKIIPNVKVEIKGDQVTLTSPDIEAVGQTCTNIELAMKVKNRDRRVFQDGIWLYEKAVQE